MCKLQLVPSEARKYYVAINYFPSTETRACYTYYGFEGFLEALMLPYCIGYLVVDSWEKPRYYTLSEID